MQPTKFIKHFFLSFLLFITVVAHAQVGIGTATPAATALLDLSSTTRGLLPPRMTEAQRNEIVSPAQGLMLYCTNCGIKGEQEYFNGTAWVNMLGSAVAAVYTPIIGAAYQGGIVAYVLVSGDPGYDATTPHGLIAATTDQSTGIRWYNVGNPGTGATGTAIGTGLSNTNSIIASSGAVATSYAAGLARAYTGGGYTDWYLPSKDELAKLYAMKVLGFGGFAGLYYWSSTESGSLRAWAQYFFNGYQYDYYNYYTYYVRAVRAF